MGGHSQGSYHALHIAKSQSVHSACLLSGPGGLRMQNLSYPSWVSASGLTSLTKIFAFSNKNDGLSSYTNVQNGWDEIGVTGAGMNVDPNTKFTGSNQFFTKIIPPDTAGSADPAHGSTAVDIVTPVDSGTNRPKFEKLWQHMCFP